MISNLVYFQKMITLKHRKFFQVLEFMRVFDPY